MKRDGQVWLDSSGCRVTRASAENIKGGEGEWGIM